MKKLSLILALVLVLTCGVLAACGDKTEESSAAESVAESAAESKAESKAESSEAATESSEAATESSEAATESSEAEESKEPIEAGTDNLAAGKTYTTCEQFRQGGADVNWGYDPNAQIAYPDETGSLTDGVKANEDSAYSDAVWAGWTGVHPDYAATGYMWMTIDLGEAKDLAKFVAYIGSSKLDNGIGASNMTVSIAVSNDGETFEVVGEAIPVDDASTIHAVTTVELGESVNAQYVQFRFARTGWVFLSELEVYAAA
ncbi:MAG: discoidin domain-containing protein [Clostridia bacterium]|nr:discoidin domain-containing protein [Clostridia bacterium]MBO5786662.1 discoidin domain-containing protein [Clostridia bacterium]